MGLDPLVCCVRFAINALRRVIRGRLEKFSLRREVILRCVFILEGLLDDRKELAQCELLDNEVLQAIPSRAFLAVGNRNWHRGLLPP